MKLSSVAILGGGPGGLYAARLLRLRDPSCRVDVYEQNAPGKTFGFGVGIATRTQRHLQQADPESFAAIMDRAWGHQMSMAVGDRTVLLPADDLVAIGRATMLDVLRGQAEAAGAHVHDGQRVTVDDLDAELVIAADGVSSPTRTGYAADFGARVHTEKALYLWCGADFALPQALFRPVETEHGFFVVHGYPYAEDRSTFLVETDEETWRRAGFDRPDDDLPPGASDEAALDYLSGVFAEDLGGRRLIGNRTRWSRFRTVSCERWSRGNVVLLGDACATAHYSIGSGTKLAMESVIQLDQAIAAADTLAEALACFQTRRRPEVEYFQTIAHRSMLWWDSFPGRLDLSVERLLIAFMSRAGKVLLGRFAKQAPDVVRQGLADFAGCEPTDVPDRDRVGWVLARPTCGAETRLGERARAAMELKVDAANAWSAEADDVLRRVREWTGGPDDLVLLSSDDDLDAVLTMCDVAERLRRELGVLVGVRADPRWDELIATAMVGGRVDLLAPPAPVEAAAHT